MSETREYLIKKGSYFYRPNYAGYTSFKFDAGRYTKERAEQEASVEPWHMEAIHQDDVPNDTAPDKAISVLIEERDRLREALEFYADELTWADTNPKDDGRITVLVPSPSFAEIDRGERAREAIASKAAEGIEP